MSAPTHTPGPWYAGNPINRGSHQGIISSETTGETIAVTYKGKDADIISAAPELLDALQSLLDWGRDHISPAHNPEAHALLVNAHAAIAKAKGGAK